MPGETIKTDGVAPWLLTTPPRFMLRRILRWVWFCMLATATILGSILLLVAWYIVFQQVLPMRRAYYLETDYQRQLELTQTMRPLIEDTPQLYFWSHWEDNSVKMIDDALALALGERAQKTLRKRGANTDVKLYDQLLGLFFDGTAWETCCGRRCRKSRKGAEQWIYLAGTASGEVEGPAAFRHKFKSIGCGDDPPYICSMYRDAFNKVTERWHGITQGNEGPATSSKPALRWANCDVNPLICDPLWGLGGYNMLIHMKVGDNCEDSAGVSRCDVTWRYIGLPMYKLPWSRMIRIPLDRGGSTVVPAFPSAEEQMWSIMAHSGAYEAVSFTDDVYWNGIYTVEPNPDNLAFPDSSRGLAQFAAWGLFRQAADHLLPEIMDPENEFFWKCHIERWSDIFLRWWDSADSIVFPRNCKGEVWLEEQARQKKQQEWEQLEERHAQKEKLRDTWDEVMKKQGMNPDWIYDQDDEMSQWARDLIGGMGVGFW